jgi:hypothetical protein
MAVVAWILERDEGAIVHSLHLLPTWYSKKPIPHHLAEYENVAERMDELHLRKIDRSDEIFVVNYADYIGESTAREVEYAKGKYLPIRWYTHDQVGTRVTDIIKRYLEQ